MKGPLAAWDAPDGAPRAVLVLAHGAGSDHRAALLAHVAAALPRHGVAVARFDFGYRRAGKKLPPPMSVLVPEWAAALAAVRAHAPGAPIFIGGKSMGGRAATHLAEALGAGAEALGAGTESVGSGTEPLRDLRGIVLLGYPLHPAGKPDKMRDAHLPAVPLPMLFLSGTRDELCDLALLRPVLRKVGRRARLHVVDDGDHGLEVRKTVAGRGTAAAWDEVLGVIRGFIERYASPSAHAIPHSSSPRPPAQLRPRSPARRVR